MLSCGRVIGRLPKLTRHTPVIHIHRPLKYPGSVTVSHLWYSKKADSENIQKPIGATVPSTEYTPQKICGRPYANDSKAQGGSAFRITQIPYWEIWGTLLVTGVLLGIDAIVDHLLGRTDSQKDVSKNGAAKKHREPKPRDPPVSSLLPQEVPYLLIGGGTAAFSAFRSIKSRDPKAKVLVITEEHDFPYMRPPLSKELWYNTDRVTTSQLFFKQWNGKQRSIFYEPQEFYSNVSNLTESDKGGVAVATGWKVVKLDIPSRTATLDDGYEVKYGKCLIATGAAPKTLPAFKSADDKVKDKILTFRTKEDFLELEDRMHDPSCKDIVIIGGGFLGSELACALARNLGKEKRVYQVFKEKHIMAQVLPEYLTEWTTKKAMLEGVRPICNAEVKSYEYKNGKVFLILTDDRVIEADQVIVSIGAEPNTELALSSYLETHPEIGGFLVNAELQARSNVWVAGDAACFHDVKLGRRRLEHHDHAVVSGRLAGENMTGAEKPYTHQSMFWSDLGPEVGYEAVGVIDSSLPTVGVFAVSTKSQTSGESIATSSNNVTESQNQNAQNATKSELMPTQIKNSNKHEDVTNVGETATREKHNDYDKGVIFYMRNDTVVGIVLWNIFNRMSIARQVLARGTQYDDLSEIAKLFTIHDD